MFNNRHPCVSTLRWSTFVRPFYSHAFAVWTIPLPRAPNVTQACHLDQHKHYITYWSTTKHRGQRMCSFRCCWVSNLLCSFVQPSTGKWPQRPSTCMCNCTLYINIAPCIRRQRRRHRLKCACCMCRPSHFPNKCRCVDFALMRQPNLSAKFCLICSLRGLPLLYPLTAKTRAVQGYDLEIAPLSAFCGFFSVLPRVAVCVYVRIYGTIYVWCFVMCWMCLCMFERTRFKHTLHDRRHSVGDAFKDVLLSSVRWNDLWFWIYTIRYTYTGTYKTHTHYSIAAKHIRNPAATVNRRPTPPQRHHNPQTSNAPHSQILSTQQQQHAIAIRAPSAGSSNVGYATHTPKTLTDHS